MMITMGGIDDRFCLNLGLSHKELWSLNCSAQVHFSAWNVLLLDKFLPIPDVL